MWMVDRKGIESLSGFDFFSERAEGAGRTRPDERAETPSEYGDEMTVRLRPVVPQWCFVTYCTVFLAYV